MKDLGNHSNHFLVTFTKKSPYGRQSPRDRAAIAKVFAENSWKKKAISLTVRTSRRLREVESYALSKFQPPTMLGDPQSAEKTIRKNSFRLGLGNQLFVVFPGFWRSQNFRRQNQVPREMVLQINLF